MARRIGICSLLLAWLCANGAMVELVQCVAWVKMFAGYVPHMSVAAAIDETLDATKPCALCKTVSTARAKSQPTGDNAKVASEKVLLALTTIEDVDLEILRPSWPPPPSRAAQARREPVPLPPPRGFAGSLV
jgi:hypothetical protein